MDFLSGYKTYLCAAAIGIGGALRALGVIDSETFQTIAGFCGAGGLAALRLGVSKINQ